MRLMKQRIAIALAAGMIVAAAVASSAAQAPTAAGLRFDVASVKLMPPNPRGMHWGVFGVGEKGGPLHLVTPGMGVNIAANLQYILQAAYGLDANQVRGLPAWTQGAAGNYAIVATTSAPATHAQLEQMLQNLLADRFKLQVRIENRTVAGFALEVDRGGLKIKPATAGPRAQTIAQFLFFLRPNADGYSCDCGPDFLPVIDKTGLTGKYDFFAALGHVFLAPTNPPGDNYYHPNGMPPMTIDELLRLDTGLRLVRTPVTQTLLTVVHLERPTAD